MMLGGLQVAMHHNCHFSSYSSSRLLFVCLQIVCRRAKKLAMCYSRALCALCRYNLSHLEQWLRDNKLQDTNVQHALAPIVQASQLLQARKTDADVDCICEMCSQLTPPQVSTATLLPFSLSLCSLIDNVFDC